MLTKLSRLLGLTAMLAISSTAMAQVPDHETISKGLNDETCQLVQGDYGDPSATMHVISHCEGAGGWTLIQHEYAKTERAAFAYDDKPDSGTLPFLSAAPAGGLLDTIDWITVDGEVVGAVLGHMQYNWQSPPPNQFLNYYAIALNSEADPSACILARVEGITKDEADTAAKLALLLFYEDWSCGTSEQLTFTAESTGSTSYINSVFEKARELGAIPPD